MRYLILITILLLTSSCASLIGIKEINTAGGTTIKFTQGIDLGFSANAIDTASNHKGIK